MSKMHKDRWVKCWSKVLKQTKGGGIKTGGEKVQLEKRISLLGVRIQRTEEG